MKSIIHRYTSKEPMLQVNAFIVETPKELVIVDTTLTMSDSKALKAQAEALGKPITGIILTHGHPDHVAGAYNLAPNGEVPIFALASVKKLMEDTEQAKHQQWSAMFGEEWVPKWVYPNEIVKGGDTVDIAGLRFSVLDIGSGGDCEANSIWLLEDENKSAFVGDFLYKNNHTYMNDGSILRWIGNLHQLSPVLRNFDRYHVGHGGDCSFEDIKAQREYFDLYCSNLLKATGGSAVFNDSSLKVFEKMMLDAFPGYGCQFMVGLSANTVAKELIIK